MDVTLDETMPLGEWTKPHEQSFPRQLATGDGITIDLIDLDERRGPAPTFRIAETGGQAVIKRSTQIRDEMPGECASMHGTLACAWARKAKWIVEPLRCPSDDARERPSTSTPQAQGA